MYNRTLRVYYIYATQTSLKLLCARSSFNKGKLTPLPVRKKPFKSARDNLQRRASHNEAHYTIAFAFIAYIYI